MKHTDTHRQSNKGKFVRLKREYGEQLERASLATGVDQQQIVQDALILYFNPNDPGARAQRDGILARLQFSDLPTAKHIKSPVPADRLNYGGPKT